MNVVGLSLGHRTVPEAEHWIRELALPAVIACTHLLREPWPHVAVSIQLANHAELPAQPPELESAARHAREQHKNGLSGRAFLYPGVDRLVGELTVAELLAASAIERVTVLGGPQPTPQTALLTRDFVRPQWMDGRLTLVATPAPGDRIAPFEISNPVECCKDKH
jgi:hypothetical protein